MVELTKFEDLQVFSYLNITDYPEEGPSMYPNLLEKGIRFAIRGAIHGDRERINVLVELRDLFEGKQIWGERYSKKMLAEHFIEIQEHVAREISGTLGSEYGIVLRRLTLDAQRQKPKILATYTAILKYYNSLVHHTPETVAEAFNALKKAVENEPGSGIALCMPGRPLRTGLLPGLSGCGEILCDDRRLCGKGIFAGPEQPVGDQCTGIQMFCL
jgi:hypothetical protein